MAGLGHYYDGHGHSRFRVFAPEKGSVAVVLLEPERVLPLECDQLGYWTGSLPRLPEGTRYRLEVDGVRYPDMASRAQPDGVHGASMVSAPRAVHSPGWRGVEMADAIIYELHLGTFSPSGDLAGAAARLGHLHLLGITVIELLPIAAFPGARNWGYDGVQLFALQSSYGSWDDLRDFIEAAHRLGIAVILDVVYNHFGPEGNYTGAFAPYTKAAATPWGAAINFDGAYNYGVREFFLENLRYWIEDAGFDGVRMDAVSLVFDNMPVHIMREFTDLARRLGSRLGRTVLTIAEHLRNNRQVTSPQAYGYDAQWNDDLNHAIFACLTGETWRHYANFGSFDDVVKALREGFVLDGSRYDRYARYFMGTDAAGTHGSEHVVHIQNHDQIGNRLLGDRMIATYGRDKALLAAFAMMASPFVPMLWMGEEYGERAPFRFFEDFSDPLIIDGAREGRKREYSFGGVEPSDPHAVSTFEESRLRWAQLEAPEGQAIFTLFRELIALKRSGALGPRERRLSTLRADPEQRLIVIETAQTATVLNFSDRTRSFETGGGWTPRLWSTPAPAAGQVGPYGALIYAK